MSKETNLERIRALVLRFSGSDAKPSPETNLFDEGLLDSFSVMQLVQALEEEFGIVFDYADLRREYFSSLGAIEKLLVKKYGVSASV